MALRSPRFCIVPNEVAMPAAVADRSFPHNKSSDKWLMLLKHRRRPEPNTALALAPRPTAEGAESKHEAICHQSQ